MTERPAIWHTFEKVFEGQPRKFWITCLSDRYYETAMHYLEHGFFVDALFCKYAIREGKETLAEMKDFWYAILQQNLGIICLTEDDTGNDTIVAFNVLEACTNNQKTAKAKSPILNQILELNHDVNTEEILSRYNVERYVGAMGLYVLPEFRGKKIGLELLKAREAVCRHEGYKLTLTSFTSPASQKEAEACGFRDCYRKSFREIFEKSPHLLIPGFQEMDNIWRYMYNVYE